MASIIELEFPADTPALDGSALDKFQVGAVVMSRFGVFWRIESRRVTSTGKVRLSLWPINGHSAPLAGEVPELPMGWAREVPLGEDFMPRPVA